MEREPGTAPPPVPEKKPRSPRFSDVLIIRVSVVWHLIVAVVCGLLSAQIFGLETFLNLGLPVQVFVGVLVFMPGLLGLIASGLMIARRGSGRYLALGVNYVGFVLIVALLLAQWGFYQSFELFVDTLMANGLLILGLPVAYGLYWLGGRFADNSAVRRGLENIGLLAAGLTLIGFILASDILGAANHILSTYSQPITWGLTVAATIAGYLAWRFLRMGAYFDETPAERTAWQGWLLVSPNVIGFTIFLAGPLLLSLYLAFTDSSFGQVPQFIGFDNFTELLSLELQTQTDLEAPAQNALSFGFAVLAEINTGDSRLVIGAKDVLFWLSLRNTLLFCLMMLPLAVLPALGLSLILNSSLPGMKFFRAVYFLPSVAAVVGTALIWRWLYDPTIGYYNFVLGPIFDFFNNTFGLSLTEPDWLTDPNIVLFSIVLLASWGLVGYNTVLFLAGLQGIPKVLYEAAMIDGANRWQQFRSVTLPMLSPTTFFVVITTVVQGLQVFNEPYALFPARPIPVNATTSVFYLYNQGFQQTQFGYASAIAWILFIIIFGITLLQFRLNRSSAYE